MILENNKIYNEDCLTTMSKMNDEVIDLVVTSPPYDNLRKYKGYSFDYKPIVKELYRVIKNGGVVVWVVNDQTINGSESGSSFRQALYFIECGFNLHDTMIYAKHNPTPNAGTRYQQCFEYMFVFSKGKPKTTNILTEPRRNECNDKRTHRKKPFNRDTDGVMGEAKEYVFKEIVPRRNIWTYKVGLYNSTKDKVAFKHPAIFPEQLAADHILSWSNEGDLVYDPFMGSGTTAKMAQMLNRQWIGSEINNDYINIAYDRLKTIKTDD